MPRLKAGTIFPSDEEDKNIRDAVSSDPDTMLLEDADTKLVPLADVIKAKRGRPVADNPKTRITIRHSPEVVNAFKATGDGWQTRMDLALLDWLKDHNPEEIEI
nr:BrnA antitoxin family protein [Pantoea agglomerans]